MAAGGEPDRVPGLILADSKVWCDSLYAIERVAKTLDDGIRHREIKVLVSSSFETRVLTGLKQANGAGPIGISRLGPSFRVLGACSGER